MKKEQRERMIRLIDENRDQLSLIAQNIKNQDNQMTVEPVFLVQQLEKVPTSSEYADACEWSNTGSEIYEKATDEQAHALNTLSNLASTAPWGKFCYVERWCTVQSFFTRKAAQKYIDIEGRNIGKSRIYIGGSFKNNEYKLARGLIESIVASINP